MATLITKNSSTASAVPAAGDLVKGELAVNVTDKKVYTKDNSAAVVKLVGSLGNQEANAVAVTGGTINGTTIGATTPSTGAFTTASASSGFTGNLTGNVTGNVSGTAANVTGVVAIANGGTGLSALGTGVQSALGQAVTGSGSFVLSTSPSLTTPNLGTPSAAVLTNATGLPLTTGVTGTLGVANGGTGITAFGTGVATALGQNVTGSGGIVLATSPSLTTPNLGTPSSATLTNATGLPISTGVSGLGTGVATALGVAVGSAGAFVVNGGALGTPSSGTLTNATGLPVSTGVSGLGTGVATALAVNTGSAGAFVVNGGALGTPSSGTVTNLTGTASININGTVGATTPTTGAFTTLSASGNITVSGGTANGVAYLNGSKVLTTGSALTFDGTYFTVGASATTGDYKAFIQKAGGELLGLNASSGTLTRIAFGNSTASFGSTQIIANGADLAFITNSAEQMRLTSTGLGIGTSSPDQKLTVYTGTANQGVSVYNTTGSGGYGGGITFGIQAGLSLAQHGKIFTSMTNGGPGTVAADMVFQQAIGGSLTEFMRASSGNLGLGVTPSAWDANGKGLQVGNQLALSWTTATGSFVGGNAYYGLGWKRIGTGAATAYLLGGDGAHIWYSTSTSGSANSAISFTQAMTLDASGNLVLGTTGSSSARLYVRGSGTTSATASFEASNSSGFTRLYVQDDGTTRFFGSSGSETARITSGGDLLVGTTSTPNGGSNFYVAGGGSILNTETNVTTGTNHINFRNGNGNVGSITTSGTATAFNTSSDYRLKDNIAPMTGALAKVAALKPVTYKWKVDGSDGEGFIAHELAEVVPQCVTGEKDAVDADGNPVYQGIDTSFLVAALTAAIQEQQAIINDLRARVSALEAK